MIYIDFDQAWQVYLQATDRLPLSPPLIAPQRIDRLASVLDQVDVVVFDAYGVLHEGAEAYDGAAAAIASVRQAGKALCVLTNDVTHEPQFVAEGLQCRGLDIAANEVISGRDLLPQVVEQVMLPGQSFGIHASQPAPLLARWPTLQPLTDVAADYAALDGVILVDTNGWDDSHAEAFLAAMNDRPIPLIVCNPDVGCPFRGQVSAEPGYFAHLAAARSGATVHFMGKPFPAIYHKVLARFPQVPVDRMLMVGDSPHTDILGARGVGMRCLLIEGGFLRQRDSAECFAQAGLWPDFVSAILR
jgi:HAD superfamily hydrolase (TIGR01459 family)